MISRWLLLALLLPITFAGFADEGLFLEGADYKVLDRPLPRSATGTDTIEVLEFFWYGCPHCYRLEPYVENWLETGKPENAEYVPVAAVLNPSWVTHAQAYYTAKALGVTDRIHRNLFDAIHAEGKRLSDRQSLAEFFAEQGVSQQDFDKAWDSFQVKSALQKSAFLADRGNIRAVPAIVVAGKYETSVTLAGGPQELFEVIDYLVAREIAAQP